MDNELREYVINKFNETNGSFLSHFLQACMHADAGNFEIVRPALLQIQAKYPLKKQLLNEQEKP